MSVWCTHVFTANDGAKVSIGTSRILSLGLRHCRIIVGEYLSDPDLAAQVDKACEGADHTYLLFPTADAVDAATVAESACPHPAKAPVPPTPPTPATPATPAAAADVCTPGTTTTTAAAATTTAHQFNKADIDAEMDPSTQTCECGCAKGWWL